MDPPGVMDTVQWTHCDDLRNVYGVDPDGYARADLGQRRRAVRPERAARRALITPRSSCDSTPRVGGWKEPERHGAGGLPVPRRCRTRPSSTRGARATCAEPGRRRHAGARATGRSRSRCAARYRAGSSSAARSTSRSSTGATTSKTSSTCTTATSPSLSRQRMLDDDGNADNQVIWFTDARPDGRRSTRRPRRSQVMDQWMANIRQHP